MKKILIVESPAKTKTISKFLGKDFKVLSTMGHIKDLPKKDLGVVVPEKGQIQLTYEPLEKKDRVISEICKEASRADAVYLAPDPDREGELIAWHIGNEVAKVMKNPTAIHRITFNEITKSAIEDAVEHPSTVDLDKVAAQQARRVLDRWVGYQVSPVLWRKLQKGLSAGRVQSVALKLICKREEEIRAFVPEEYWSITGLFITADKATLSASLAMIGKKKAELKTKDEIEKLVPKLRECTYQIASIKDSKRQKKAAPPFMTSTLQQAAYNQLGFSVQRTMSLAQQLYEGVPLEDKGTPVALITYMRTDSLRIAQSALEQARKFITKAFGKEYLPAKSVVYSKEKAQDAHEAIRPIDVTQIPESVQRYLDPDLFKLYQLIWKRFVACQMKPAEYAQRAVTITGGIYTFKATGSTLLFDGFLKAYSAQDEEEEDEKNSKIPADIREQMELDLNTIEPKQHFTQAPPRYTEASLVKELEKERIGRPSTYATILKTIQLRSYTELDKRKRFVPTELGFAVTKLLDANLPKIMDVAFTAHMEEDLDKVAQGNLERDVLLREFYQEFSKDLTKFAGDDVERPTEPTNILCPECKQHKLVIRFGRAGAFIGCPGYPDCTFSSPFKREDDGTITLVEKKEPELLEETCPKCGKPLQKRVGRFGEFTSCSGYPECKYIKQETTKFMCPGCKQTPLVRRSWKGKVFWSCQSYPACKFSISGDIQEIACPQCASPYLLKIEKDDIRKLTCPNRDCGFSKTESIE